MKSLSKVCLGLFLIIFVLFILLTSFVFAEQVEKVKEMLIIGIPSTPTGIDPDVNAEPAGADIQGNLYDWMISLKFVPSEEPGMEDVMVPDFIKEPVPSLFESWELAKDYSSCIFKIRKGVKSAWGNEFTTEDIKWKLQRNLALKGNGAFMFGVINCDSMDNLEIIDKYTFRIIPNKPAFNMIIMWSNLYFPVWDSTEAKKHITADDPWAHDWIATHGDGYGPYYIKEWKSGEYISLEANPNTWRGAPKIKKLLFKVIPDSSSRLAMLKDGTIDVAMNLSPREIDSLKNIEGDVRIINLQGDLDMHILLNQAFDPFKDKKVRQAIQYAIPQNDICKLAFYGQAIPWKATIPSMFPSINTDIFPYDYNLVKAKELLKETAYKNGFDVELYYNADLASHETSAVLIKDSLSKVGINVNLRKTPPGSFTTGVLSRNIPFSLWNDFPCIPDPFYAYMLMYYGPNYHCYENYSNPEADRRMIEGNDIVDKSMRYAAAQELEKILLDDVPVAWGVEQNYTCAIRKGMQGFNWDISNNVRYDFVSFK